MRILIIGGNGFIGKPLVRQLNEQEHSVAVFHRGKGKEALPAEVEEIIGDRRELGNYRGAIREFAPEVVIDLILSSGKQAEKLIETVRGIGFREGNHRLKSGLPRIVAISSMDVYRACGVLHGSEPGPLEPLPLTEESPLRKTTQTYPMERLQQLQNVFGWIDDSYDKVAVERAIGSASDVAECQSEAEAGRYRSRFGNGGISATILRLPMVYGPGDHLRRLFPIVKRIEDRRPAILYSEAVAAWRSPRGYVENVAAAIALAATSSQAAGRIYNVAEQKSFSELEWAQKIADRMDWQGRFVILPRERTPENLLMPGNFAQHWVASSERIRRELGYEELVKTDEAIRRTIEWERRISPLETSLSTLDYAAEDSALAKLRLSSEMPCAKDLTEDE
ncbi:MAG: NAD-dependent dehydratase [Verrucomicrobia bacterium]|nr:MAG: NAD-dependent dehydratase [Verrucomicrobiota bacterium]